MPIAVGAFRITAKKKIYIWDLQSRRVLTFQVISTNNYITVVLDPMLDAVIKIIVIMLKGFIAQKKVFSIIGYKRLTVCTMTSAQTAALPLFIVANQKLSYQAGQRAGPIELHLLWRQSMVAAMLWRFRYSAAFVPSGQEASQRS